MKSGESASSSTRKPGSERGGQEERYDNILAMNRLLFVAAFIKEKLAYACTLTDKEEIPTIMNEIISFCEET